MPPENTGKKKNPAEKLQEMIDSSIERAFAGRDQKEKEEKDPWAKLQGMINRSVDEAVGRRFDLFAKGLEEEGGDDDKDEGGEVPKLGILGL